MYLEKTEYDYVLWKALKGDDSDNIAGFSGIGDKKAKKMCLDNSLLDKFLLTEGHREKLNHNIEMIRLHDLNSDVQNINYFDTIKSNRWNDLKQIFENYNFNSMTSKEKSWDKFTKTFDNLWENINVN